MSLLELQQEIAQLSSEDRERLRRHLDHLDFFSDPEVMEELTLSNREARAGRVHTREEVIAALKKAGKQVA